jgi:hypothetical protein
VFVKVGGTTVGILKDGSKEATLRRYVAAFVIGELEQPPLPGDEIIPPKEARIEVDVRLRVLKREYVCADGEWFCRLRCEDADPVATERLLAETDPLKHKRWDKLPLRPVP